MEKMLKQSCLIIFLSFVVFLVSLTCAQAQGQENMENNSLVGRIAHIQGQLLRYVPEEDDWVIAVEDTPFGTYDVLYSSDDAKAEIILPNNTWVRIGSDTQIQLIELKSEITELEVSSGSARLYNKSLFTDIKATTPFGDVLLPPETRCDLYVHEKQAEVVALKGTVDFVQTGSDTRHAVIAGSSSLLITPHQVIASSGSVHPEWNAWNIERDFLWTQRMQARGTSGKYLPAGLKDEAYVLEKHGRWERVYYEGAYNYFWRPAYVGTEWTPFSSGRWTIWHAEHTWVPDEPFGYVTHHYGNWIYARNCWYWGPPVSRVMVSAGLPLFNIGISWYPGRVAWIHSGVYVGWIPLAPYETYYSHHCWGSRSTVRVYNHYYPYNIHRYRHYRHARVIDQKHFYRVDNYRHAGLRKFKDGKNYRMTPFAGNTLKNHHKTKNRFQFTNVQVKRKPDRSVIAKIKENGLKRIKVAKARNDLMQKKVSKIIRAKGEQKKRIVLPDSKQRKKGIEKLKKSITDTSHKISKKKEEFRKTVQRTTKKVVKQKLRKPDKLLLAKLRDRRQRKNTTFPTLKINQAKTNRKTSHAFSKSKKQKSPMKSIAKRFRSYQSKQTGKRSIQARTHRNIKTKGPVFKMR